MVEIKLKAGSEVWLRENYFTPKHEHGFFRFARKIIDPEFFDPALHGQVCFFLQHGGNNKVLVLPRSFLKTSFVDAYIMWRACYDPGTRSLKVSNTDTNAGKSIGWIRGKFQDSSFLQAVYSHVIPDFNKVSWSNSSAELRRPEKHPEGTFESAGVGTNIVRRHYNTIIQDDTIAPRKDVMGRDEIMPTRDDIEKAIGFHKLTFPLLVHPTDERIIVCTRWAQYDLINYIKENEPHFKFFDIPAIKDGQPTYRRFNLKTLEQVRRSVGSFLFSSLYLNSPLSSEHMVFNPKWTQYYTPDQLPKDGEDVVTIDPADPPTGKSDQCYSAIIAARHCKQGMFVRKAWHGRITDSELIEKALDIAIEVGAIKVRIETDRYAHMVYGIKDAMARRKIHLIIEDVKTRGRNKEARIMHSLQPLAENGCLYITKSMAALEDEMYQFPNGKFCDLLDALAWQMPSHKTMWATELKQEEKLPANTVSADAVLKELDEQRTASRYPFDEQLSVENLHDVGERELVGRQHVH